MRYPVIVFFFFLIALHSSGQVSIPVFGTQEILNGYSRALEGETMPYFSIYPEYAKEALLTRSTDGKKNIEWETSAIPAGATGPYVYFSWIAAHSTGTNSGIRNFDLYINDSYILTFVTYPKNYPAYWSFGGGDSTRLVFELKTKDGAADAHGIAYLRVPLAKYEKGKPLKLKVVGQNQKSSDWYMTFMYTFKEKLDIEPLPFLLKGNSKNQSLLFTVLHFGAPAEMNIRINGHENPPQIVNNGLNSFELPVTAVSKESRCHIEASLGNLLKIDTQVLIKPVTPREIYLVHHSHNDIGYSNIQEDVEDIQNKNISDALHLINLTKKYPAGSRFVWNVESLWAVENFLNTAPEKERKEFITAVQNKQIGLSGLYANILTGLCTPEEMEWITGYATMLRMKYNFPIQTAMMTDIPGMSWSMVHALASHGIRYFSNGPNYVESLPDKGDRIGSTLKELGDKPFWWKSSSGKDSILFWTAGKGYSSWHGFTAGTINERGKKKIARYLDELDKKAYPYSVIQWRYNIVSDNGPVDSGISDFVKDWNQKYSSPTLILANASEPFIALEKKYGHSIPHYSGDFTPYWEDGAYSTASEEGQNRELSEKIIQFEKTARILHKVVNPGWFYKAKRNVIMFHEHTWGSWNSISDPDNNFTIHQWDYKKRFIDSAEYFINKIGTALFPSNPNPKRIVVINTLPWPRSGYVEIAWPAGFQGNALEDERGNKIVVQKLADGRLAFITNQIPANSKMQYYFTVHGHAVLDSHFPAKFKYSTNGATTSVNHINYLDKEWVHSEIFKGVGQPLYVKGLNPDSFFVAQGMKSELIDDGPVTRTERITALMPGTDSVGMEITQFKELEYMKISVIFDKKPVREKESVHIAFPFSLDAPIVRIGVDDSFITPEHGQIPGSNKDFFSVQRWLDVSGKDYGVTLSSPQGALFETGKMINEQRNNRGVKQWDSSSHSSATVFLYAMNNYWHTNYKADQAGRIKFDFILQFHRTFDLKTAQKVGMEATQPLLAFLQ